MNKRLRLEIAHEAAKILIHSGNEDYLFAKTKAANRLGVTDNKLMPSNVEIESALIEYQSLYESNEQANRLNELRLTTLKAMQLFKDYSPLLTGPVLNGTANQHSEIILHLFEDAPELIGVLLDQKQIPKRVCERRLQFRKNTPKYFTAYAFLAGETDIVAIILPAHSRKHSPLDPVNGKPARRANIKQVEKLIDDFHASTDNNKS